MSNIVAVPRGAILDNWINDPWTNGVQIDKMADMQRIHVRTVFSLYEITVIDGRGGDILVRGGSFFPELTEAHLAGATLGGCFCKMRGIYCGFKMEFGYNCTRIVTSDVQTIIVFADHLEESFAANPYTDYKLPTSPLPETKPDNR
jgi:hypothetical protein